MEYIPVMKDVFHFKRFDIFHVDGHMKVSTDSILLGAWVRTKDVKTALDIGTGTGVIAIMLAQRSRDYSRIYGLEVDEKAYRQAMKNARISPWADRLHMVHNSVQQFAGEGAATFDMIVSNPPFFTSGMLSGRAAKNVVRHTVKLSHRDLLLAVDKMLSRTGRFSVILPVPEGLRFVTLAEDFGLFLSRMTEVSSVEGKPVMRLLLEFSRYRSVDVESEKLTIHKAVDRSYTSTYMNLTKEFYLNF